MLHLRIICMFAILLTLLQFPYVTILLYNKHDVKCSVEIVITSACGVKRDHGS